MIENNLQNSDSEKKVRVFNSLIIGLIAVTIFVVGVTIIGELYKPLKDLLADVHNHHWIGKGIWSAIVFVVVSALYFFFANSSQKDGTAYVIKLASILITIGSLVLLGFFLYEFYAHI